MAERISSKFSAVDLGTLRTVAVRTAWPDEARNFTGWLGEEGIQLLGSKIGMSLRLIRCEHTVGKYSLDVLAADAQVSPEEEDEHLVIIENQFGVTDHKHLGQLLTYAAGVGKGNRGARTVIWIAEEFGEEHKRALEWLNQIAGSETRFYGVQIELYQIGESPLAPDFKLVVEPNELIRAQQDATQSREVSEWNLQYVQYWTDFKDLCINKGVEFQLRTPKPTYYLQAPLGRAGCLLAFLAPRRDKWIGCEVTIRHAMASTIFAELEKQKEQIELELGFPLDWERINDKYYKLHMNVPMDPGDRSSWYTQHDWLIDRGESFFEVFAPRLR